MDNGPHDLNIWIGTFWMLPYMTRCVFFWSVDPQDDSRDLAFEWMTSTISLRKVQPDPLIRNSNV